MIENCKLIIENYCIMPTPRRLEKINELIYRFISELLKEELDTDAMVTVSGVETSANGQECVVGITVFPFEKSPAAFKEINRNIYEIQQKMNRGLNMRPVPKIRFKIDESIEKGSQVLRAIDEI